MDTSSDVDLEALAALASQGDAVAMEALLAAIQPRVRRICGRILIHPQDAEDATQECLLSVATKVHTYDGRSLFTTWLHVVASNSARSTYRTLKRRASEHGCDVLPQAVDPRTTSVIAGSRLDLLEALDILGATHPEMAEALVLRDVQDLPYDEIAHVLGVPLGTVKAWIHRARNIVQPLLRITD